MLTGLGDLVTVMTAEFRRGIFIWKDMINPYPVNFL